VDAARKLAEEVLFPAAMEIDGADVVPRGYLDQLADAGLYDLDAEPVDAGRVIEVLGGASLAVAFVWIQHHSVVRAISAAGGALRDEWLGDLRSGRKRAGIAYAALRRMGPPTAVATRGAGKQGWTLDGHAPWVTGWGLIDVVLVGARSGDDVVWLLIDAVESQSCVARRVELAALDSSSTVELRWSSHHIPESRVVGVEPYEEWLERDASGLQTNGYLGIGVAARCCRLLGSTRLDADVDAVRGALDVATPDSVVSARAASSLLAVRAATALVASGGGRSAEASSHASRLMREAMFLLVFGQTADIKAEQLRQLGARRLELRG
jgi:alkylation response protein AidB-like acyl-CoA dehydrogenase